MNNNKKLTKQQQDIINVLKNSNKPLTDEEIADELGKTKQAIWNNLRLLEKQGYIKKIDERPRKWVISDKIVDLPPPPTSSEIPLCKDLLINQRNSDNPTLFEVSLTKAFKKLGFKDTKHLGGKDEADIVIESYKVVIDAKTTKEGVINEGYVNFPAMRRYREKYDAEYIGIVAPGFAQGNLINTAEKEGVVLIETEAICELLQNHAIYPYETKRIVEILFRSGKSIITRKDIPPSTIDKEKLIDIVANTLQVLKNFEKVDINRFSSNDLRNALVGRGLTCGVDEVEDALKFLSTYPVNILQKQDDKYFLTANIDLILRKIGLLIQAFKRMGEVEYDE